MLMPHRIRPAALLVTVLAVAACHPSASPDSSRAPGSHSTSSRQGRGLGQCQPGWVCGTCPDGTEWGYLDDPRYTSDPQLSTLFFDDRHPCG